MGNLYWLDLYATPMPVKNYYSFSREPLKSIICHWNPRCGVDSIPWIQLVSFSGNSTSEVFLLLMAEILHQLIGSFSHYL